MCRPLDGPESHRTKPVETNPNATGATAGLSSSASGVAQTTLLGKPAVPPAAPLSAKNARFLPPARRTGRATPSGTPNQIVKERPGGYAFAWQKRVGGRKPLPTAVLSTWRAKPHSALLSSERPDCLGAMPTLAWACSAASGNTPTQAWAWHPAPATEPREGNTGDAVTHVDSNFLGKRGRYNLCQAPYGPFRQMEPVPVSLRSTRGTPRPPGKVPTGRGRVVPAGLFPAVSPCRIASRHGASVRHPKKRNRPVRPGKTPESDGPLWIPAARPALRVPIHNLVMITH